MRAVFLLTLFLFAADTAFGQPGSYCNRIKDSAQSALNRGELRIALVKLRALKVCDPSRNTLVDSMILEVYDNISRQKGQAEAASKAERKAKDEAMAAQRRAERQTEIAESRLKTMVSRKLAAAGLSAQSKTAPEWHLSLLLGMEAMKLAYTQEADHVIRNAMDHLPVLLKADTTASVYSIAHTSPGGKYFAARSFPAAKIMQRDSGKELFQVPCGKWQSLLFCADEHTLITGSDNHVARIIQLPGGKVLDSLVHEQTHVELLAVSDDQRFLATQDFNISWVDTIEGRDEIIIWDLHSRKIIQRITPAEIINTGSGRALFKRIGDQQVLVTGLSSSEIWQIGAGKTDAPEKHPGLLANDGNYWLQRSDKQFSLYNFTDNKLLFTGDVAVKDFCISPDAHHLITYNNSFFQVWDIREKKKLYEKQAAANQSLFPVSVVFSDDGSRFSFTSSTIVWDTYSGNILTENFWSEDVKVVRAGNSYENSRIIATNELERYVPSRSALFFPTGDTMYTITDEGDFQQWLIKPGNTAAIAAVQLPITDIYSSTNHIQYISDYLKVYKHTGERGIDTLGLSRSGIITAIAVNEKKGLLAYGEENLSEKPEGKGISTINLLNGDTGFIPLLASLKTIDIDPSGKFILAGTRMDRIYNTDHGLWLLDVANGTKKKIDSSQLIYHKALFWKSTDKILFVADPEVMLKDLRTNEVLFREKFDNTNTLTIDRNYKNIAIGNREHISVYGMNKKNERSYRTDRHFEGDIVSGDFSPSGDSMLIGLSMKGGKGQLVIWNLKEKSLELQLTTATPVTRAVFDRAVPGNIIIAEDRFIKVYQCSRTDLLKQAVLRVVRPLTEEEWNVYVGREFPFHMKSNK